MHRGEITDRAAQGMTRQRDEHLQAWWTGLDDTTRRALLAVRPGAALDERQARALAAAGITCPVAVLETEAGPARRWVAPPALPGLLQHVRVVAAAAEDDAREAARHGR
ncbi:hypothetical protein ACFFKU_16955 [Kineococcus gynurae]|uniref:Uncharacterized protein n=1 Tax=Kineococcus gynurae TaxID=452979 RepID=A0ABV5LP25_9ACTN